MRGSITFLSFAGTDGQVDMRLIYGTTVAKEKDRHAKEDKVHIRISLAHTYIHIYMLMLKMQCASNFYIFLYFLFIYIYNFFFVSFAGGHLGCIVLISNRNSLFR